MLCLLDKFIVECMITYIDYISTVASHLHYVVLADLYAWHSNADFLSHRDSVEGETIKI